MPKNVSGQLLLSARSGARRLAVGARLEVRRWWHLAAPEGGAAGRSNRPADQVVGALAPLLEDAIISPRLPTAIGSTSRSPESIFLSRSGQARDAPEHAEAPIAAVEGSAFSSPARAEEGAIREEQLEREDVVAERPHLPVVLAVDVHRRRPASVTRMVPGTNRRPPAVLDHVAPELR